MFEPRSMVGGIMGLGDVLVKEVYFPLHDGEEILDIPSYCNGNDIVCRFFDVRLQMVGLLNRL